jgi:hypothetical protein
VNKEQFHTWLAYPDRMGKEEIAQLDSLVQRFPYASTLQILKAKALKNTDSIYFDTQLRLAAAYAPNRKVLYYLIHTQPPVTKITETSPVHTEEVLTMPEEIFIPEPVTEEQSSALEETIVQELHEPVTVFIAEEKSVVQEPEVIEEPVLLQVEEAIPVMEEQTLVEEVPVIIEEVIEEETLEVVLDDLPEPVVTEEPEPELIAEPQGEESPEEHLTEVAEPAADDPTEETVVHAVPEISHEGQHSFNAWLKKLSAAAEAHEDRNEEPVLPKVSIKLDTSQKIRSIIENELDDLNQLIVENVFHEGYIIENEVKITEEATPEVKEPSFIDRFIKTDPVIRMMDSTKESQENKAKRSAEEQNIPVTETLAQIYMAQRLYPKAIQAYEKLSLKYPEKKSYFANLIEKIKSENQIS